MDENNEESTRPVKCPACGAENVDTEDCVKCGAYLLDAGDSAETPDECPGAGPEGLDDGRREEREDPDKRMGLLESLLFLALLFFIVIAGGNLLFGIIISPLLWAEERVLGEALGFVAALVVLITIVWVFDERHKKKRLETEKPNEAEE